MRELGKLFGGRRIGAMLPFSACRRVCQKGDTAGAGEKKTGVGNGLSGCPIVVIVVSGIAEVFGQAVVVCLFSGFHHDLIQTMTIDRCMMHDVAHHYLKIALIRIFPTENLVWVYPICQCNRFETQITMRVPRFLVSQTISVAHTLLDSDAANAEAIKTVDVFKSLEGDGFHFRRRDVLTHTHDEFRFEAERTFLPCAAFNVMMRQQFLCFSSNVFDRACSVALSISIALHAAFSVQSGFVGIGQLGQLNRRFLWIRSQAQHLRLHQLKRDHPHNGDG